LIAVNTGLELLGSNRRRAKKTVISTDDASAQIGHTEEAEEISTWVPVVTGEKCWHA